MSEGRRRTATIALVRPRFFRLQDKSLAIVEGPLSRSIDSITLSRSTIAWILSVRIADRFRDRCVKPDRAEDSEENGRTLAARVDTVGGARTSANLYSLVNTWHMPTASTPIATPLGCSTRSCPSG